MKSKINLQAIKTEAAQLYLNGDYYCSEAIVATIRKHFDIDMPLEAVAMASGFPIGVGGTKCMCGAIPGGVICIGYFFGRTTPGDPKVKKTMELAQELVDDFKGRNKVLCCHVLTKGMEMGSEAHKKQCAIFTGEVAEKTAEILARELGL